MSYPVSLTIEYEQRRSRLSTFFRGLLIIPISIWVAIYAIPALIAVVIAWFAIVITGRYPQGLYNFVAGFLEVAMQMFGYYALACDGYPPFVPGNNNYAVQMTFDGPLPKYSRLLTFFRGLVAIPLVIIVYVLQAITGVLMFFSWIVIVITGRMPEGLFSPTRWLLVFHARTYAYLYLLTQSYPPFSME